MIRLAAALSGLAFALAAPAPALAGPAGFSDPVHVGLYAQIDLDAAVAPGGDAVVASVGHEDFEAHLTVAVRPTGESAPWTPVRVGRIGWPYDSTRNPSQTAIETAVTPDGRVVVAWVEGDRTGGALATVIGSTRTGRFGAVERRPLGPVGEVRLVALPSGYVLMATRAGIHHNRLRLASLGPADERFGPARTITDRGRTFHMVGTGAGAVIAWTELRSSPRSYRIRAVALGRTGRKRGRSRLVAGRAMGHFSLAGASDGRAVVSWWRPGEGRRTSTNLTRAVLPRTGRARAFPAASRTGGLRGPQALALGRGGLLVGTGHTGTFDDLCKSRAAVGWLSDGWTRANQLDDQDSYCLPQPAALDDGTAIVVWRRSRDGQVFVASGPGLILRPEVLDPAHYVVDSRDIAPALASAGKRAIVAWGTARGVVAAERR